MAIVIEGEKVVDGERDGRSPSVSLKIPGLEASSRSRALFFPSIERPIEPARNSRRWELIN